MIQEILEQYWGYRSFRPMQEAIINDVLAGNDVFAMLPTGGGKSLTYQVPAIMQEGICIVVSPLIALMQDQVSQLKDKHIPAAAIYTGMRQSEIRDTLNAAAAGRLKLLYISPERIHSEMFQDYLPDIKAGFVAVDEAHCISQWGHNFRPAYRSISLLRQYYPAAGFLALTASATPKVQEDIIQQLELRHPKLYRQTIVRPNLYYHVDYSEQKKTAVVDLLKAHPDSALLYTRSRKLSVEMAELLKQEQMNAYAYHAGMYRRERELSQQEWMQRNNAVMCATTAFGMGIDKPDVRLVAHYNVPESLEEYYQEAGRAGRDGHIANAYMFYNAEDIRRLQSSIDNNFPPDDYLKKVYRHIGDYLQIPTGDGYERLYDFDVIRFISNFKLDTLATLSAVKLLEREGFWIWNEHNNARATIVFTASRNDLNYLETAHPGLHRLCVTLLRLYDGIYHFPAIINEYDIARLYKTDMQIVTSYLKRLDDLGIIDYQPAYNGGTLYWMRERVADAYFRVDHKRLEALRAAHRERVNAMLDYINGKDTCRNILLARYFGEDADEVCGACDVCTAKSKKRLSKTDEAQIMAFIKEHKEISLTLLLKCFSHLEGGALTACIRRMNDEGLCRIYPTGIIFAV